MGSLEGKIALVTGASRGIGAAIARRFGAEGATVIVTARTLSGVGHDYGGQALPGSVEEVVAAIKAGDGRAAGYQCDIADAESRARLADRMLAEFGRLDILVNNATATAPGAYHEVSKQQFQQVFQINIEGSFDLIQRFGPGMQARGQGWILNLSSAAAEHPEGPPYRPLYRSGMVLYGAAKAALNRMTTGLAAEMEGTGVAVNALAPVSVVWTPGAAASGLEKFRSSPEWVEEPVEGMAEAALALCTVDPNKFSGRCVYSTKYLNEIGRKIRTLDGRAVLEGWKPAIA